MDGHFCYAYKISIVTNGLGIVRHLNPYNKDFLNDYPEIVLNKKTDSSDEDKFIHDARLLLPTLSDFFKAHPLNNPKTFPSDAAFDSVDIYKELLAGTAFGVNDDVGNKHFSKAYIPLNSRSHLQNQDYTVNGNDIPCCPHDLLLPMKSEGVLTTKSGIKKYKFVCPKMTGDYDPKNQHSH